MNCTETRPQLPLLLYGELSFDEEEAVESHLDGCTECRTALERERELSAAFDQITVEPSPALLRECRENLFTKLEAEPKPARAPQVSWWERFISSISFPAIPQTAGAVALLAMGFLGARLVPAGSGSGLFGSMSVADFGPGRVHSVESGADGTVKIEFEETRRRTVSGRVDDESIKPFMLSALREATSDGTRAQAATLLAARPEAADVRNALVYSIRNDRNSGVRLKALHGLKAFLGEAEVRAALADVLAADSNPSMRMQAIDFLMQSLDSPEMPQTIDPRMVGVLQTLSSSEDENPYLRARCQRALELVKASAQVF